VLVPWVLAALGALGALLALDARGVALNLVDATQPLAKLKADAGAEERAARDALEGVREKTRRGDLSLDQYREKRREASAAGPTQQ
jgi:hypothetical protein